LEEKLRSACFETERGIRLGEVLALNNP
jgi:hypothetical protein